MTGLGDERPAVTPAKRRVLADEVADAIREAIVTGQLDLGERLPEVGLAADLRVSRGPVREALARLSQEGLVQMERHRGATVARLGPDEVHEIYSLRKELEGLATEWFCANGTEEDFEQISLILKSFDNLPRPLVRADVARLDVAFHDSIFQGAHHRRLYEAWLSLRSQLALLLVHGGALRNDYAESWRQDHEDLLRIFVARRPADAVNAVIAHIDGAYRRVLQAGRDAAARGFG